MSFIDGAPTAGGAVGLVVRVDFPSEHLSKKMKLDPDMPSMLKLTHLSISVHPPHNYLKFGK
jgi:hypothetical protein